MPYKHKRRDIGKAEQNLSGMTKRAEHFLVSESIVQCPSEESQAVQISC